MPVTICKFDLDQLEHDARRQLMCKVLDDIRAALLAQTDDPQSPLHQDCYDCHGFSGIERAFTAAKGKAWTVIVKASMPDKPSKYGADGGLPQHLEICVEHWSEQESESSDDPNPLMFLGCLPAALVVVVLCGMSISRHFFLDPGDNYYLTTTQSRWLFLGGLAGGGVTLVAATGVLMLIGNALKAAKLKITDNSKQLAQLEHDIAAKIDVAALDIQLPQVS